MVLRQLKSDVWGRLLFMGLCERAGDGYCSFGCGQCVREIERELYMYRYVKTDRFPSFV